MAKVYIAVCDNCGRDIGSSTHPITPNSGPCGYCRIYFGDKFGLWPWTGATVEQFVARFEATPEEYAVALRQFGYIHD